MLAILIGCIPAIIIRWVLIKKPLSYGVSIFISMGILSVIVASEITSTTLAGAISATSFFILIHKSKKEKSKPTYCKYCNFEVELDKNELIYKKFICPECGKENELINNETTPYNVKNLNEIVKDDVSKQHVLKEEKEFLEKELSELELKKKKNEEELKSIEEITQLELNKEKLEQEIKSLKKKIQNK